MTFAKQASRSFPVATGGLSLWARTVCAVTLASWGSLASGADPRAARFQKEIQPILVEYCYDCHADGMKKGKMALDEFKSHEELLGKRDQWLAVLKNVRAGLMPPQKRPRPSAEQQRQLETWIKDDVFDIDPANPDPGRITIRRLNRVEYRNTIRDLMGVDFNSEVEFPPDDTGGGFDNNGDVLTLSPLLIEKYLAAAENIVDRAVPKTAKAIRSRNAAGRDFRPENSPTNSAPINGEQLYAREPVTVSHTFKVDQTETYQVAFELESKGSFDYDAARCKVICRIDGEERSAAEVAWGSKTVRNEVEVAWPAGPHVVSFEIQPLSPPGMPAVDPGTKRPTRVDVRIASVQVRGPLNPRFWKTPENHARFFPSGPAPEEAAARDRYAGEVLRLFATKAFRRPVEATEMKPLVDIARSIYTQAGKTFEEGISRAMMGVLASPRFLFRIEEPETAVAADVRRRTAPPTVPPPDVGGYAAVDEYSLASRLSYFLWSTMPDDELFRLAGRGELRRDLRGQVQRMLKDPKSQAFVRNFTGQWLEARDVEFVPINARAVLKLGDPNSNQGSKADFDAPLRQLMRRETEMYFEHIIREDRSILELVDSDYTFLNQRLATHYGVPDVTGEQLRLVRLPPGNPRGGVLTQGTVLTVTSNPTRTSPVKRGLFILENILGTPPPPAPPDIPSLEDARKEFKDREPKLSEMLAVHRGNKLCSSCHTRMDPLGLAFENFNALGNWRDTEAGQPIEPAGQLITGEPFADVRELKRVLARDRRMDFYRCLTEKLLTYALGRGLESYDVHTSDQIVERLNREDGRFSALLMGIAESAPFQKRRNAVTAADPGTSKPVKQRAAIETNF